MHKNITMGDNKVIQVGPADQNMDKPVECFKCNNCLDNFCGNGSSLCKWLCAPCNCFSKDSCCGWCGVKSKIGWCVSPCAPLCSLLFCCFTKVDDNEKCCPYYRCAGNNWCYKGDSCWFNIFAWCCCLPL